MKKVSMNSEIKNLFKVLKMDYIFDSIYENFTYGNIFINNIEKPTLAVVIEDNSIYFGGEDNDINEYYQVIDFFKSTILKKMNNEDLYYVVLKYTSDLWGELLIEKLNPIKATRFLYQHDLNDIPSLEENNRVKIAEISSEILNSNVENINYLKDEIIKMWGSIETFIEDGFGYCALNNKELITWVTSEYMSKHQCGIGIETIEKYQKQGLGSLATTYLLKKCKELNITPHWDCWEKNVPSSKIANKVGFQKIIEHSVLVIELK